MAWHPKFLIRCVYMHGTTSFSTYYSTTQQSCHCLLRDRNCLAVLQSYGSHCLLGVAGCLGSSWGMAWHGTISLASHAQQLCASDWWPKRWKITDLTIFIIRVQKLGRLFDDLRRRGMTLFYSSINSISSRGVKLGIPTWASSLWMSPSSPVQRW